jgi:predicted DNA-binding protein YlxM (UPF0122 family)
MEQDILDLINSLTQEQIDKIKFLLESGVSLTEVAEQFNVPVEVIEGVC